MLLLPTEKKKAQPKSWELCFILQTFWGLQAREAASQDSSEGLLAEVKEGSRTYRSLGDKNQVAQTSRESVKEHRHLRLRNLELFFEWKELRAWAHWSHPFDMHFSYLGPVSCSFPSRVPHRVHIWGRLQRLSLNACNILCLVIQQVVSLVHISLLGKKIEPEA